MPNPSIKTPYSTLTMLRSFLSKHGWRVALVLVCIPIYNHFVLPWTIDRQIDSWCKKEGIKVYEAVPVTRSELSLVLQGFKYNKMPSGKHTQDPAYKWTSDSKYVMGEPGQKYSKPLVTREHIQIYRTADGKLLGESVHYVRTGGDLMPFFGFMQGGHMCRQSTSLLYSVFKITG